MIAGAKRGSSMTRKKTLQKRGIGEQTDRKEDGYLTATIHGALTDVQNVGRRLKAMVRTSHSQIVHTALQGWRGASNEGHDI